MAVTSWWEEPLGCHIHAYERTPSVKREGLVGLKFAVWLAQRRGGREGRGEGGGLVAGVAFR
jgi:hypothetical protein